MTSPNRFTIAPLTPCLSSVHPPVRHKRPSVLILLAVSLVWLSPPVQAAPPRPAIHVLDLTNTSALPPEVRYDLRHAAVCIQGLANRQAPRVFLKFHRWDGVWLDRLREPGGLCEGWPVRNIRDLEDLLARFRTHVKGVVLYDPNPATGVISTSLAATTAAGVEGAIALRKDPAPNSLYNRLVNDPDGPRLPVLIDLTGKFTGRGTIWDTDIPSTGSARCDAYVWARHKYLDTGKCDPTTLSYSLDLWGLKVKANLDAQLSNLDYAVSRKGFCFELTPWGDEAPNDDPQQPVGTDRKTFMSILDSCNRQTGHRQMIKFVGFVNWPFKYTKRTGGKHEDVATEWETARFLTAYNCYKEADAAGPSYISNSSFYHGLLPAISGRRYTQNPPPTREDLIARGLIGTDGKIPPGNYVCIALGDYDQASWTLYLLGNERWNDPARGQAICNWGIDPNAVDRAGVAMDYFYRHKSAKDFFFAWDSGAGYVNPTQLHGRRDPSGYPSGVRIWQEHCRHYYRMFDYSISGWLLNGSAGQLGVEDCRIYAPFSGDGIGTQDARKPGPLLVDNVPIHERFHSDAFPSPLIDHPTGVHFAWYRTILISPKDLKAFEERHAKTPHNHRILDIFTYYYLMRHHLGGRNEYRATWLGDTIPRLMTAGRQYTVTVTVRNDGWDTWTDTAGYRLGTALVAAGAAIAHADYDARGRCRMPQSVTVAPGGTVTFSFTVTAPKETGSYELYYDMVREGVTWFREQNNIEWKMPILVTPDETRVDTDGDGMADLDEIAAGRLWWHPDA